MGPIPSTLVRSVLLPANLIVAALVAFGVIASTVEGDLRRVPRAIDPDLARAPAGAADGAVDPAKHGKLTVQVARVRNATGKVQVWVYDKAPLTDGANIVARRLLPASPQGSTAIFEDLPYGPYAVMAVHDENQNENIDMKGTGGPPAEGIGNSNGKGPLQAPPSFEDSRFVLDRDALEIEIPLFYY